ncbi:hypothetical protein Aduo_007586 [Ancylostoma duodenale]
MYDQERIVVEIERIGGGGHLTQGIQKVRIDFLENSASDKEELHARTAGGDRITAHQLASSSRLVTDGRARRRIPIVGAHQSLPDSCSPSARRPLVNIVITCENSEIRGENATGR